VTLRVDGDRLTSVEHVGPLRWVAPARAAQQGAATKT
jgi:hypothetical protein